MDRGLAGSFEIELTPWQWQLLADLLRVGSDQVSASAISRQFDRQSTLKAMRWLERSRPQPQEFFLSPRAFATLKGLADRGAFVDELPGWSYLWWPSTCGAVCCRRRPYELLAYANLAPAADGALSRHLLERAAG